MPRSSLNLILTIAAVSLLRFVLWYYLDWTVEKSELLSILGVTATATVGYSLLPSHGKKWFSEIAQDFLTSARSTKILAAALCAMFVLSTLISRIDVEHSFDSAVKVNIDGTEVVITGDGSNASKSFYGISFTKFEFVLGRFESVKRFTPLLKTEIIVPYEVGMEQNAELQRIEEALTFALFQFYEARYFSVAKNLISAQVQETAARKPLERLSLIEQILELSIIGTDVSGARRNLLHRFRTEFGQDSWLPILESAVAYSHGEYSSAAEYLAGFSSESEWPGKVAASFFKGVCDLRSSRSANGQEREKRLGIAYQGFKNTERLALESADTPFRSHALGSAVVFQGIHFHYKQDIPRAKEEFARAAQVAVGPLRARAYNGVGYLEFIEGDIVKAEIALLKALEGDSNFAYALSNYGYVLMAKNQFEEAISYFERNANNDELKSNSYRDVLLAKLAIGHAKEEVVDDLKSIADYYAEVLEESGRRGFYGLAPLDLRLAYQYSEMAEKIYLSKDYYGLEVFALALLSKAKGAIQRLKPEEMDERVTSLQAKVEKLIEGTKKNVPIGWLSDNKDRGEFFGWIRRI